MPRIPDATSLGERPAPEPSMAVAPIEASAPARATAQVGQDFAVLGDAMMRAEQAVQTRADALERLRSIQEFTEAGSQELQRLTTEDDFSRPETMGRYGTFLNERKQKAIQGHRGSPASQQQLLLQIDRERGRLATQAGTVSHQAQLKMVEDAVGRRGNVLAGRAYENPGSLVQLWRELDEGLNDIAPALKPEQETQFRNVWRGHMAQMAIESLVVRGNYADAETLLQMPGISDVIGPEQQKAVRRNILEAKYKVRNAAIAAVAEAGAKREGLRVLLGREPTDLELAQAAGVVPKTGMFGDGLDGRVLQIMTDLSPAYAQGLLTPDQERQFDAAITQYQQPRLIQNPDTGLLETRRPDLPAFVREALRRRGNPSGALPGGRASDAIPGSFPRVTPEEQAVRDREAAAIRAREGLPDGGGAIPTSRVVAGSQDRRQTPTDRRSPQTIWDMAGRGMIAGPVAGAVAGLSRTPVVGDVMGQTQTVQARQMVTLANNDLVRVLQNNPRFAEGERKQIQDELSINPQMFDTSTALRDRLIAVDNALEIRYRNALSTLENKQTSKEDRQYAMSIANAIPLYRKTLGVPPRVRNDNDFAGLPSGAEFIDPEGQVRRKP